jgi:site-specific DNA-methyltransferase (adenine-specific)
MIIEPNNCYNIDCAIGLTYMRDQGLKADWCITDPPYGINIQKMCYTQSGAKRIGKAVRNDYTDTGDWDSERVAGGLFDLIFECSEQQLIFGGNYYTDILPPTKSWCVWNKRHFSLTDRNDFADCELAWVSKGVARMINYMYNGMLQDDTKNKDIRFHPTQKPTQMWVQILLLYTKENDLILDPFAGSQSLRIACHKTNRRYIGFEINKDYYDKGCKWFEKETAQISIMDLL